MDVNTGDWAAYAYDGWGRRTTRQSPRAGTEQFVYDGANLWADLDGAGNYVREYSYFPGIDRPHGMRVLGAAMYYFHQDARGDAVGVTRADGTLDQWAAYTPYGVWAGGDISHAQGARRLQWKGREWDDVLRGYFMRARYYDPESGRFLSEDPSGLTGGANLYAFAGGDPINASDPSGLRQAAPGPCTVMAATCGDPLAFNGGGGGFGGGTSGGFGFGSSSSSGSTSANVAWGLGLIQAGRGDQLIETLFAGPVPESSEPARIPKLVYEERTLNPPNDRNHRFPFSFDPFIVEDGYVTYGSGGYLQYNKAGVRIGNDISWGIFEIGGHLLDDGDVFSINHRFYRPIVQILLRPRP